MSSAVASASAGSLHSMSKERGLAHDLADWPQHASQLWRAKRLQLCAHIPASGPAGRDPQRGRALLVEDGQTRAERPAHRAGSARGSSPNAGSAPSYGLSCRTAMRREPTTFTRSAHTNKIEKMIRRESLRRTSPARVSGCGMRAPGCGMRVECE